MKRSYVRSLILSSLAIGVCPGIVSAQQKTQTIQKPAAAASHAPHPSRGPHGGELLEIGNEEFHAEIVVDEVKKQFLVYLLEKDAKSSLSIDEPYLMVNLLLSGKPMQIKLPSIAQETNAKGASSCYGAVSPELVDALHAPKADPRLATRIHNKAYVTKIVHKHDHSGHNHAQQPAVAPAKRR
jgi:hypothetical protein